MATVVREIERNYGDAHSPGRLFQDGLPTLTARREYDQP
jgi:hypothetical protein